MHILERSLWLQWGRGRLRGSGVTETSRETIAIIKVRNDEILN